MPWQGERYPLYISQKAFKWHKRDLNPLFVIEKHSFFQLGFTPCTAQQPMQGMELQEKEAEKDNSIHEICLERTYN